MRAGDFEMPDVSNDRVRLKHVIREDPGTCLNCGAEGLSVFYESLRVPAHSVLLMRTREEAIQYPKGDIQLGFCPACGFISNVAFNPDLHEYSTRYEETQGYSPTFREFHQRLADQLIERFALPGKKVIEIGCGKGEFLALLCERGGCRGVGYDPAFVEARRPTQNQSVQYVADFYSEKYAHEAADLICCKMTLEHIPDTYAFVRTVRRSIDSHPDPVVFFQIPDTTRILKDQAFWDIYYEHCSYFTADSLAALFRRCGFQVRDLWTDYDDQYLMIEARPGPAGHAPHAREAGRAALAADVDRFCEQVKAKTEYWKGVLAAARREGERVVIWGGGSKGVTFLSHVPGSELIEYAVDINPYKHGTFLPGTGQETVPPEFLKKYRPDLVIVMNPVYVEEITADLGALGLHPRLLALD